MFWRQKDWSGSEVKPCNSVYIANIFQSGPKKQLPHIIMLRHVAITLHYNPLTWFINLVCRQRCALLCLAHPLASCLSCLIVFTRHLTLKPDGGFMKNVAHVDFAEHPFLNFLFSPFKCSFCSFYYPFCRLLSPSSDKRRRLKGTIGRGDAIGWSQSHRVGFALWVQAAQGQHPRYISPRCRPRRPALTAQKTDRPTGNSAGASDVPIQAGPSPLFLSLTHTGVRTRSYTLEEAGEKLSAELTGTKRFMLEISANYWLANVLKNSLLISFRNAHTLQHIYALERMPFPVRRGTCSERARALASGYLARLMLRRTNTGTRRCRLYNPTGPFLFI